MLALKKEDIISIISCPVLTRIYSDVLEALKLSRGEVFLHPQIFFNFQKNIILDRITALETELKKLPKENAHERAYKYMIRIYKWIMDGVALRALAFNPNSYRILSDNRTAGFITDKTGLSEELKLLNELTQKEKFAALNDLTNFIRIGDISILEPGSIELIEVKSGTAKNNPRKKTLSFQDKRMKTAEEMINKNICVFEGDKKGRIEILPIKAKTYLNKIKDLLIKAERDGASYATIDESTKVTVLDFQIRDDSTGNFDKMLEGFEGFPDSHEKLPFSSIDLAYCEQGEFFRGVLPPSVWKLPNRLIADIMTGRKLITVHFSFTNFYNKFRDLGFEIEIDKTPMEKDIGKLLNKKTMPLEKSRPPSAITVKRNGWYMEIPDTLISRIGYEFLHPNSAVELVKYHYDTRHKRPLGYTLPIFHNHRNLYR